MYVHIPFCAARCDYCDFATWTDRGHLVDAYVTACVADVERHGAGGTRLPATSVFFGGGTPSLIPADRLVRVLDAIGRVEGAEVTVEANPESLDIEKATTYAGAGVTRISIGVQSSNPHVLTALGRRHTLGAAERAVAAVRAARIPSLNLDLIYGTPGESIDDWRRSLDAALALGADHVSAYALTVEPGTALGRRVASGAQPAPDDDDQAAKYELADDMLTAAGFEWYEISSWARPGHECRHHLLYWSQGEYVGIGAAAHGHADGTRRWNVRTPERYIAALLARQDPVAGSERVDGSARAEEAFMLALRTRTGARVAAVAAPAVEAVQEAGLVDRVGDRVVLTRRGRLLAGDVTSRLLAAGAGGVTVVPAGSGAPGRASLSPVGTR